MTDRSLALTLRRYVADALVGLAVFILVAALAAGPSTLIPPTASAALPAIAGTGHQPAAFLLAGVFSLLVTLDVAFFRHLCRAYAFPRRVARKTGRGRLSMTGGDADAL
jgi:hypothetical protein